MMNTLKLYWILNPPYQKKAFIGISIIGVFIAQLLFSTQFGMNGSVSFGSICYCAYFLFLSYLLMYNFMSSSSTFINGSINHNILPCLLQMHNPKDIFIKGIILNNIIISAIYFIINCVVMSVLAIFSGFHSEILIATLWSTILSTIFGILINIAMNNGKKGLSSFISIFYLVIFFLSSLWLKNINSLDSNVLHYFTQVKSLLIVLPMLLCTVLISYNFGMYCYRNRREAKKKR